MSINLKQKSLSIGDILHSYATHPSISEDRLLSLIPETDSPLITSDMIQIGLKKGFVKLINCPDADGVVCQIGDNWFYFGGIVAAELTLEQYISTVPESVIISEITAVLSDFVTEFPEEYKYYAYYLRENLAA